MDTARIRRTFKYPEDDDVSDGRDEMDEEGTFWRCSVSLFSLLAAASPDPFFFNLLLFFCLIFVFVSDAWV